MNDILDFIIRHWQLSSLFVALLVAYILFEFKQETSSNAVSPDQAVGLMNHQHAVLLDIRPKETFAAGHILGAQHVDPSEADAKLKRFNKYAQKPVIVVCARGISAVKFAQRLRTLGLAQAVTLAGGMNAWLEAGLPTTSGHSKEQD